MYQTSADQRAMLRGRHRAGCEIAGRAPVRATSERAIEECIERAYAEHHGALFGQLVAMTRDPATAEDFCQEAFLRLTREARAGRMPGNIGGWLHRVAANLVTSRARRSRTAERWSASLVQRETETSPEEAYLHRERNGTVRAALSELNETDRAAVLMAASGYRGRELARSLRRSESATRTVLCRARSKLRTRLATADVRF
jgi:RNA polymerase sigma-70 factor, ECF subfamily